MTNAPEVRMAIIIVHYRTPELLRDCLATLRGQIDARQDRIVVVDNASGQDTSEVLKSIPGINLLLLLERNLGFAGANNAGIRSVFAQYYLLLNPDTLVRPGAIGTLLEYLKEHREVAMVGPRLEYPDGRPQLSAFGDVTPLGELIRGANVGPLTRLLKRWQVYGAIAEVESPADWLGGACVLLRREVLTTIGLLDADFFMYFEEVDFCRRARHAGFAIWYVPEARVVHLVGQSSGVTTAWAERRLPGYWFASRHRYFRKHFGYAGAVLADACWLLGHGIMWVRKMVTGVSHSPCAKKETRDFLHYEARHLLQASAETMGS